MDVHKVANNCISGSYISIARLTTSQLSSRKDDSFVPYFCFTYFNECTHSVPAY